MKTFSRFVAILAIGGLLSGSGFADTLVLKSGTRVSGSFEGGTARFIKFRAQDGTTTDYDILSVQEIQFDAAAPVAQAPAPAPTPQAAPPQAPLPAAVQPVPAQPALAQPAATASAPSNESSSGPILRSPSERPPAQPPSASAANTAYTIATGEKIVIRMVDSVNSETQQVGQTFVAILDEPIVLNGIEIAAKGSDVRGRISNINEAGRIAGAAELGLELTQLYVNGIPYALSTSEYAEAGDNRAGQTARRAGVGAGIGAIIGAIAGGGKGAAIGAGVGAGAGTAVQVATKGERLNIPAETRLEFTLRSPLVIAGK